MSLVGATTRRSHRAAVPIAATAVRSLPRRRVGVADAQGVRACQGAGARDTRGDRALPPHHDGNAPRLVPVVARARIPVDDLGGTRGGCRRLAVDGRRTRLSYRAVRPGAGPRGVPADPHPGCQLPRERGRHDGGGAGLRSSGTTSAGSRLAHRRPGPGRDRTGRARSHGRLSGARRTGTRSSVALGRTRRDHRAGRRERMREVDAARGPVRLRRTDGRVVACGRRRPDGPRPRRVAPHDRVGPATSPPVRGVDRRQRAPRLPRRAARGGPPRGRARGAGRRRRRPAARPRHRAR